MCLRFFRFSHFAVYFNICCLFQNMLTGIADGVQPLFSMCAAKENMEKKEKQIKGVVTRLVVCVSILVMLLFFAAAPVFHKVFSLSSENYEPFVQGLRITAISLLFYGLNRLSITIMNGKGQLRKKKF